MRRGIVFTLSFLVCVLLTGGLFASGTQESTGPAAEPGSMEELIAAAKEEGVLVLLWTAG